MAKTITSARFMDLGCTRTIEKIQSARDNIDPSLPCSTAIQREVSSSRLTALARFLCRGLAWCFGVVLGLSTLASAATRRTDVVFILTDNQGAWTLGCYGNPDIRTPHIDRLAAEGIRFIRALSSNPVCSPTRATFLTGLIPSQYGIHTPLSPVFMMGPRAYTPLADFTSLGEVLRDAGYVCG